MSGSIETTTCSTEVSSKPYHVLMNPHSGVGEQKIALYDPKLQLDYLSKRSRAFQRAAELQGGQQQTSIDPVWCDATPLERSLIECCYSSTQDMDPANAADDDDHTPGALAHDRIVHFVGLLALYCHDIGSRSLALAILERTEAADDDELEEDDDDDEIGESPRKKQKTNDDRVSPTFGQKLPDLLATVKLRTKKPQSRLSLFFKAGGLRILSQWLSDSSTPINPVTKKRANPSSSKALLTSLDQQPSPTGPLLLPLIKLLARMRIDRESVTKSGINKQIREHSKQIDAIDSLLEDPPSGKVRALKFHPVGGGNPIRSIQDELNFLKENWSSQAKESNSSGESPFKDLEEKLKSRLSILEKCSRDGELSDPPAWLVQLKEKQVLSQKKNESSGKRNQDLQHNTKQLARLEREHEREFLMKKDLERTQQERRELLQKLRSMKLQQNREEFKEATSLRGEKRRVKWKDGYSSSSTSRNRDLLEQVRIIEKKEVSHGANEIEFNDVSIMESIE